MAKPSFNQLWLFSGIGLCLQPDFAFSENLELPAIHITAQKRFQRIEDAPIAATVIDQEALDQRHAKTLWETQGLAPNVAVIQNGLTKAITIRGVGGGGRNIGFETRTGVYIDGVYVGQSPALESPIFEVDQIEVLRGPQGFLFGRNTDAGALNITTKPPSELFEGYVRSGVGNLNYFENVLMATGPIKQDLLGKLTLSSETRDGFIENTATGDELKNINRFASRGQLRYLASEQLTLDLSADYANIHHTDFLPQATSGLFDAPLSGVNKSKVNVNNQPYAQNEIFGGALKAEYLMNSGHTFTYISAVRRTKNLQRLDNDYSTVDLIHTDFADEFTQLSQELRINSAQNQNIRYVAGIYAEHEIAKTHRTAFFGQDTSTLIQLPGVGQLPFNVAFGISPDVQVPHQAKVKTDGIALFGSVDIDIHKLVTLNIGGRYNSEYKQLKFNSDGSQSGALNLATLSDYKDARRDDFFSPMLGATIALSPDLKAYTKYSRGFKSGGWNVDFLSTAQVNDGFQFSKETVDSIEAGLKGQSDNRRWQYDVTIFRQRYHDFQVFQFDDLGTGQTVLQLRNAAEAETKGIETSFRGLVGESWRLSGALSFLDARFSDFPNGSTTGNAAGQRLPDAPKFSARASIDYTLNAPSMHGKFNFFIEDAYQSKTYSGISNDQEASELESRHLVNAQIKFISGNKHWELGLWARNLFDKHYAKAKGRDFFGNRIAFYGDPRFFGVTGQYNF